MKRPIDMLIYYGYLNSFNSATHSWNNEKVAQELARYGLLAFGDGLQASSHPDYANTKIIIASIKELNPEALIFGYVSINQSYSNYKTKVDEWNHADLNVHGIFMDEAGYDYGTAATNGRDAFNDKTMYTHSKEMFCFANAWKPEHVLSNDPTDDDSSYANSTWNADSVESVLQVDDWLLLESYAVDSSGNYESGTQWASRGDKVKEYEIQIAASSVISDTDSNGQDKMDYIYTSALMQRLDAVGSSNTSYGSGGASKMWARKDISRLVDTGEFGYEDDGNVYLRYLNGSLLKLDSSSGSQSSDIVIY